jgi:hypothetical protein
MKPISDADDRTAVFRATLVGRKYAFHRITSTVSCITTSLQVAVHNEAGESEKLERCPSSNH